MSRKRKHRRANARAERLRDGGPDETGRYGVNPYAARGHVVEVAPKELRSSSTSDQFPKRVITQRMLDRYRAHGHITPEQWRAGNALWEFHVEKDRVARTTSGYDPVMVQSSPSIDGRLAKYLDAALGFHPPDERRSLPSAGRRRGRCDRRPQRVRLGQVAPFGACRC
jgi:hypothetical protein